MEDLYSISSSIERCVGNLKKCTPNAEILSAITEIQTKMALLENRILAESTSAKSYNCTTCGETEPRYFNRKISECTQCISKAAYAKMKPVIEKGKARNVAARIKRGECHYCKTAVTEENALSFDWDHRDPTEKATGVSKMNRKSDEEFFAEIAKCDLVCRNCHIIRTQKQFTEGLLKKKPNMKEKEGK